MALVGACWQKGVLVLPPESLNLQSLSFKLSQVTPQLPRDKLPEAYGYPGYQPYPPHPCPRLSSVRELCALGGTSFQQSWKRTGGFTKRTVFPEGQSSPSNTLRSSERPLTLVWLARRVRSLPSGAGHTGYRPSAVSSDIGVCSWPIPRGPACPDPSALFCWL